MLKLFIKKIFSLLKKDIFKNFAFIESHSYIKREDINLIENLIYKKSEKYKKIYEKKFSNQIGEGQCLSYASGRMALYSLLKCIGLKEGDHVLVTAFTCSAVPEAVIKAGGRPIYLDINKNDLSASFEEIKKKISKKTKALVLQHSFGIPSNIIKNLNYLKKKKIFIIEDCALSFGSKYKKKNVGNFGDASFFSTDHSKSLNTIVGGIAYTNNKNIYKKLYKHYKKVRELPLDKKKSLFKQFLLEKRNFKSNLIYHLYKKIVLCHFFNPFFDNFKKDDLKPSDHYAFKMPVFLCYIGILELNRWINFKKNKRKKLLKNFLYLSRKKNIKSNFPNAYYDKNLDIVPSRLVYFKNNNNKLKEKLSKYFNIEWIWFKKPVDNTNLNLSNYYYHMKECKNSEDIGKKIINIPVNFNKYKIIFE